MSSLSVRSGDVTITLSDDLSAMLRARVEAAMPGVLAAMEGPAEAIASRARAEWYGPRGVEKDTGKGGEIVAVSTVDAARGVLRVSIGSLDTRTGGKVPVPLVQRSPGVLATEWVTVTPDEYWRTPESLRGPFSLDKLSGKARDRWAKMAGRFPVVRQAHPNAGKGHGALMSALVWRPVREQYRAGGAALRAVASALASGVARG